jgi:hypothetical protein
MTVHKSFLLLLLSINFSCNTRSSNTLTSTNDDSTELVVDIGFEKPQRTSDQYCYITSVFEKADTTYIGADFVQYLTGEAAIEAARKANEVDTFTTKEGNIEFSVPNGYFVLNESRRSRKFVLSKDCSFDLIYNPNGIRPITDNSLKSLKEIYLENIFMLTIDKNGHVTKIKEVFLP